MSLRSRAGVRLRGREVRRLFEGGGMVREVEEVDGVWMVVESCWVQTCCANDVTGAVRSGGEVDRVMARIMSFHVWSEISLAPS